MTTVSALAALIIAISCPQVSLKPALTTTDVATSLQLGAILEKMTEYNRFTAETLRLYEVDRVYKVENRRVNKAAVVRAAMVYVAPDERLFEVQAYSGSGFMRKAVLNRLIETERQTARAPLKDKTALTSTNYEFALLRSGMLKSRSHYVLRAKPRRKDKLLFDGTVWVDAEDFAVTRIEGRPAKNPSFWTRKVDFIHEYEKVGPFWLSARNTSTTAVFLFGRTTTEVEYINYRINTPGLVERAAELRQRTTPLEIQIERRDR